jgi:hypothetical protein
MYKKLSIDGNRFVIVSNNNSLFIPKDEDNTDYQEYLAWLAEGNEPEVVE